MHSEIEQLQRRSSDDLGAISLAGGLPAEDTFPCRALANAFSRALATDGAAALQYGWPEGRLGLRRWIAEWLTRKGASVDADDVIVTSGAQQALAIALESLCSPDDAVLVDGLTYPGALDLARLRGITPSPRRNDRTRAAYTMPAIGNPLGVPMSADERCALVAMGVPIIEDDAYADLRFDGTAEPPLLAHDRSRVWHIGTFSKTICPGLRVGWLVPPRGEHARALGVKHASDLQANTVAQALLEAYLRAEDFDDRLVALRAEYRERAEILVAALERHAPDLRLARPAGGFAIWAESDSRAPTTKPRSCGPRSSAARASTPAASSSPTRRRATDASPCDSRSRLRPGRCSTRARGDSRARGARCALRSTDADTRLGPAPRAAAGARDERDGWHVTCFGRASGAMGVAAAPNRHDARP